MTAEIIVKNIVGCALAADSAMTMQPANSGTVKIFNSAEKIFDLSKKHPIGVMIYNSADFCGTPWDLSIRMFRKLHGKDEKAHVRDYVESFLSFISNHEGITPANKKYGKLNHIYVDYLKTHYENLSQKTLLEDLPESDDEAMVIVHDRLKDFYSQENQALNQNDFFVGFTDDDFMAAKHYAIDKYFYLAKDILPNNGFFPDDLANELVNFFANIICKRNVSSLYTGLVFAGYGSEEYYPAVVTLHIYGWFNGKVIYYVSDGKSSPPIPESSTIIPFASEEEVFTFVKGCNSKILDFTGNTASQLVSVINNQLLESGFQDQELLDKLNDLPNNLMMRVNSFSNTNFMQKVTAMLDSLSKKDLAYMAESLVNLSAFKLKISDAYETVGGPIDVAVISKTDGFIWIKRKLYFDKNLNNNHANLV